MRELPFHREYGDFQGQEYELTDSQPERLVLTGTWASQADLDGHDAGRPLKRLNEELDGQLAHPVQLNFA